MATGPLSPADVRKLLAAVESLLDAGSVGELRERTVSAVVTLVPSDLVAWNEVDPRTGMIDAVLSAPLAGGPGSVGYEELAAAFGAHVSGHPVIANFERTGDGRSRAISDFVSRGQFHRSGIYQHFYRYLGAEDQLSFEVGDHGRVIGVASNRDRPGFSQRDRLLCDLLRPQVALAYRNAEVAGRAERAQRTIEAILSAPAPARAAGGRRERGEVMAAVGLSAREAQVMDQVARGLATKRIARLLGISPRTVDKHVEHACVKLGVQSRMAAVALVTEMCLEPRCGEE